MKEAGGSQSLQSHHLGGQINASKIPFHFMKETSSVKRPFYLSASPLFKGLNFNANLITHWIADGRCCADPQFSATTCQGWPETPLVSNQRPPRAKQGTPGLPAVLTGPSSTANEGGGTLRPKLHPSLREDAGFSLFTWNGFQPKG